MMLHDWKKVQESPVFTNGFHPMTGHDKQKRDSSVKSNRSSGGLTTNGVSEHAEVRIQQEADESKIEISAH